MDLGYRQIYYLKITVFFFFVSLSTLVQCFHIKVLLRYFLLKLVENVSNSILIVNTIRVFTFTFIELTLFFSLNLFIIIIEKFDLKILQFISSNILTSDLLTSLSWLNAPKNTALFIIISHFPLPMMLIEGNLLEMLHF